MDATALKYAVACVAVLAFTGWNRDVSLRAFGYAILLTVTCVLTNVLNHTLYFPEAFVPYPIIDATCGVIVAFYSWRNPKVFELLLSGTFLTLCARHAIFWWGQAHGQGYEAAAPYMDNLSDIFKMQLAIVCIPGGLSVARLLYDLGSRSLMRMLHRPVRGLARGGEVPPARAEES